MTTATFLTTVLIAIFNLGIAYANKLIGNKKISIMGFIVGVCMICKAIGECYILFFN